MKHTHWLLRSPELQFATLNVRHRRATEAYKNCVGLTFTREVYLTSLNTGQSFRKQNWRLKKKSFQWGYYLYWQNVRQNFFLMLSRIICKLNKESSNESFWHISLTSVPCSDLRLLYGLQNQNIQHLEIGAGIVQKRCILQFRISSLS